MGKDSKIAWVDHTLNLWIGCDKVSPGCAFCYAERDFGPTSRFGKCLKTHPWGPNTDRHFTTTEKDVRGWQRAAQKLNVRHKVFCSSLCDVFEDRRDLDGRRETLWKLIAESPNLDFLLLTKRIEKVRELAPWKSDWPSNVWIGATCESQELAKKRVPLLLEIPAVVHFLSVEPMLGPLDISQWAKGIDWVICGGESGNREVVRQIAVDWVRSLKNQCLDHGIAFFLKQWGDSVLRPSAKEGAEAAITIKGLEKPPTLDGQVWNEFPNCDRKHREPDCQPSARTIGPITEKLLDVLRAERCDLDEGAFLLVAAVRMIASGCAKPNRAYHDALALAEEALPFCSSLVLSNTETPTGKQS